MKSMFSPDRRSVVGRGYLPSLWGDDVVYQPVPASRVRHSRNLHFVYHTPDGIRAFTSAEIRDLPDPA